MNVRNICPLGERWSGVSTIIDVLTNHSIQKTRYKSIRTIYYSEYHETDRNRLQKPHFNFPRFYDVDIILSSTEACSWCTLQKSKDVILDYTINMVVMPSNVDISASLLDLIKSADSAILVVDVVASIGVHLENFIKHVLNAGLKPVLFINKLDTCFNISSNELYNLLKNVVETYKLVLEHYLVAKW
jgi:hypothetical protein